eukprot:694301-Amphidinium_carterae.1
MASECLFEACQKGRFAEQEGCFAVSVAVMYLDVNEAYDVFARGRGHYLPGRQPLNKRVATSCEEAQQMIKRAVSDAYTRLTQSGGDTRDFLALCTITVESYRRDPKHGYECQTSTLTIAALFKLHECPGDAFYWQMLRRNENVFADVFDAIGKDQPCIPHRNCCLTHYLKEALGGHDRLAIISLLPTACHGVTQEKELRRVLIFASQASQVVNLPQEAEWLSVVALPTTDEIVAVCAT